MKKVTKAQQAKRKKVAEKRAAYTKARLAKKYQPKLPPETDRTEG
ncbi:MAG: hypothetical protein ABIR37_04480 [Candidatus Saccharimonadales bacterium]